MRPEQSVFLKFIFCAILFLGINSCTPDIMEVEPAVQPIFDMLTAHEWKRIAIRDTITRYFTSNHTIIRFQKNGLISSRDLNSGTMKWRLEPVKIWDKNISGPDVGDLDNYYALQNGYAVATIVSDIFSTKSCPEAYSKLYIKKDTMIYTSFMNGCLDYDMCRLYIHIPAY